GIALYFLLLVLLSLAGIRFIETLHRLPVIGTLDASLLASQQNDRIALVALTIAAVALIVERPKAAFVATVSMAATFVFLQITSFEQQQVVFALLAPALLLIGVFASKLGQIGSKYFRLSLWHGKFPVLHFISGFFSVALAVELFSIVSRFWEILSPNPAIIELTNVVHFHELEDEIWYSIGQITPILMILVAFSFL